MEDNDYINYARIERAINYIKANFKQQPSLDDIAKAVNLSAYHFHRLFSAWAGTTPKNFLQYVSIEYAKKLLKENRESTFETAAKTGLSGTGRLHDLFVSIEGMTPGEYKKGGQNLCINYSFEKTKFGEIIIASTAKGICHLMFSENREIALSLLKNKYPYASFISGTSIHQQNALQVFRQTGTITETISLHIKGSDFQMKVWESLLTIPEGNLTTYGNISKNIKNPSASRAVGTAVGANPIALIIPCHRVIQSSGVLGGYMWGETRKAAIIGWEAAQTK